MFFDIFNALCKERGVSCKKAATEMGLSNSIQTKWKKGGTPNGGTLSKIAEYFGVTTDYLLGKEDEKKPDTQEGDGLTQEEWEIILRYRAASAEIKDAVQRVVGDGK